MDKQTLLEICKPFKRIEINGEVFHLRRLSPKQFKELQIQYFSDISTFSSSEADTVIDTEMPPEERKKLPKRLQDKIDNIAEYELDILTYSLCEEDGKPVFGIEERETVRLFDPAFLRPLKEAAYEFSYGYYHKQAEIEVAAKAKKKRSKKTRFSALSIGGRTPDAKQKTN